MSIIDTLASNIPDAVLDQVYALQQRRLREIDEQGTPVTITSISSHPTVKTIMNGSVWYFSPNSPIKPGSTVKDGSVVNGTYIVTETQEQAGRLACSVQHLPDVVSFFTGESRPADFGVNRVSLKATEWRGIPCARTGNKLVLPATYAPVRGDILLIDGKHYTAAKTRQNGAVVEAELEAY